MGGGSKTIEKELEEMVRPHLAALGLQPMRVRELTLECSCENSIGQSMAGQDPCSSYLNTCSFLDECTTLQMKHPAFCNIDFTLII